jgi:hypothetical protein
MNRIAALAAGLLLASPAIHAQDQNAAPSPEQTQQMMEAAFGSMVPYMSKMVEATIQTQLRVLSQPESAAQMATYIRNLYNELVKQGFSEEQALRIASSLNVPSASSLSQ